MTSAFPVLSVSIWLPIFAGLAIILLGQRLSNSATRLFALVSAVLGFLVTIPLITGFDLTLSGLQFTEKTSWIDTFKIFYALGVDGLSMWFVPLTALITVVVVIAGWEVIEDRVAQYMGAFLILSGLMIGVFSAVDGLLFYVFFEATLIPLLSSSSTRCLVPC